MPGMHIPTSGIGVALHKLLPKKMLPNIPVLTTLSTFHPPAVNLETGHITGSQTLKRVRQSPTSIMSKHFIPPVSSKARWMAYPSKELPCFCSLNFAFPSNLLNSLHDF